MQYLIIPPGPEKPFYTNWFEPENHFSAGMLVIDLLWDHFTDDGVNWLPIQFDHL